MQGKALGVLCSMEKGLVTVRSGTTMMRYNNINCVYRAAVGALGTMGLGARMALCACLGMERSTISLFNFTAGTRLRAFGGLVDMDNMNPGTKLTILSRLDPRRITVTVTSSSLGAVAETRKVNGGVTREVILRLGSGLTGTTGRSDSFTRTTRGDIGISAKGIPGTVRTLKILNCSPSSISPMLTALSDTLPIRRLVSLALGRVKERWRVDGVRFSSRFSFRGEVASASRVPRSATRDSGPLQPGALSRCVKRRGTGRGLGIFVRTTGVENRALSRMLLCNPPKLNGAALSKVVTGRLNISVEVASNPTVRGPNSLTTLLAGLGRNSILFVSRVRELDHSIRRVLCPSVRSFTVSVVANGNRVTTSCRLPLPGFALIKTAAETNRLATPLHSHFNIILELRLCAPRRLTRVIREDTKVLKVGVRRSNTLRVTSHSEKAPQVTGQLLGHIHSFTRIVSGNIVALRATEATLSELRVSRLNLSHGSEEVLRTVIHFCGNNPIKLRALTTTVNRRTMAVRSICRPCLLRVNFIDEAPENEYVATRTYGRLNYRFPGNIMGTRPARPALFNSERSWVDRGVEMWFGEIRNFCLNCVRGFDFRGLRSAGCLARRCVW